MEYGIAESQTCRLFQSVPAVSHYRFPTRESDEYESLFNHKGKGHNEIEPSPL